MKRCWPLSTSCFVAPSLKEHVRPPKLDRSSIRVTATPASVKADAADAPANPPPTTTAWALPPPCPWGTDSIVPRRSSVRFLPSPLPPPLQTEKREIKKVQEKTKHPHPVFGTIKLPSPSRRGERRGCFCSKKLLQGFRNTTHESGFVVGGLQCLSSLVPVGWAGFLGGARPSRHWLGLCAKALRRSDPRCRS
jgi:hypothetical protein